MFSPTNDTRVSAWTSRVRVFGFTPGINADIRVFASRNPTGPWTEVDRFGGSSHPVSITGGTVYEFRKDVLIPTTFWRTDGCDRVTYVRSTTGQQQFDLYSFDRVAPDGQSPENCVLTVANATSNLATAASSCASSSSPVARVRAPGPAAVRTGSLTLRTPADAEAHQCLEVLNGDLIVRADPSADLLRPLPPISLPNLRQVRGNLDLVFQQPFRPGGRVARPIDLPLLGHVTGDIRMDNPRSEPGADLSRIEMGMPNLYRIDGDLSMTSNITGSSWFGMDRLRTIPGDVTVSLGGDWFVRGLGSLTTIRGNLTMNLSSNGSGFAALRTIHGNLTQTGGNHFDPSSFAALTRVVGDVRLTRARTGSGAYPALATIDGRLVIDNSMVNGTGALQMGAASGLAVQGGLTVQNTGATTVGIGNVRLQGTDRAEFRSNTRLCTTAINRWLDGQSSWSGPRTLTGNSGC